MRKGTSQKHPNAQLLLSLQPEVSIPIAFPIPRLARGPNHGTLEVVGEEIKSTAEKREMPSPRDRRTALVLSQ